MKRRVEVLQLELPNRPLIHLHKEGMFYRAYEYSAYYFHRYIQPAYQIYKRFYRVVSQDLIYIGFPTNMLPELLKDLPYVTNWTERSQEDLLVLRIDKPAILQRDLDALKLSLQYTEAKNARNKQ